MKESTDLLIVSYLNGEATPQQQAALLDWLTESEEHKRYFRSLKDVYDLGRMEADMHRSDTDDQWQKFLASVFPTRQHSGNWLHIGKRLLPYAAIFILGLVCMQLVGLLTEQKKIEKSLTKIETGVGERSKVSLPDGSTVWVNACSAISYDADFGDTDRAIQMKGEAYFHVKKDPSRPFLVQADKLTFRVTGTSFNVYSFDDEASVSIALIEGAVVVEYAAGSELLHPGEMLVYDKQKETLERKQVKSDSYTAWRYGEMVFNKITFEDLTRRLERNFSAKFKFEDPAIKNTSFSGSFRKYESLETILKVISTSMPVQYKIEKDTVYIK